jgi:hypothetical protein
MPDTTATADRPQPVALPVGFTPYAGMTVDQAATYLAAHAYPDADVLPDGVAEISWLEVGTGRVVADGYFSASYSFLAFTGGPEYRDANADRIRELTRQLRFHFNP